MRETVAQLLCGWSGSKTSGSFFFLFFIFFYSPPPHRHHPDYIDLRSSDIMWTVTFNFLCNFFKNCYFSWFLFWIEEHHMYIQMQTWVMSVYLCSKRKWLITADSFFLQKIDELRLCPDAALRKKSPVNHTQSGAFTICLPTDSHSPLIKANIKASSYWLCHIWLCLCKKKTFN